MENEVWVQIWSPAGQLASTPEGYSRQSYSLCPVPSIHNHPTTVWGLSMGKTFMRPAFFWVFPTIQEISNQLKSNCMPQSLLICQTCTCGWSRVQGPTTSAPIQWKSDVDIKSENPETELDCHWRNFRKKNCRTCQSTVHWLALISVPCWNDLSCRHWDLSARACKEFQHPVGMSWVSINLLKTVHDYL